MTVSLGKTHSRYLVAFLEQPGVAMYGMVVLAPAHKHTHILTAHAPVVCAHIQTLDEEFMINENN